MKRLFSIIWLTMSTLCVMAVEITGRVIDAGTKQAIDFANVSVEKVQGDNTQRELVTGTITDEKGNFTLDLKNGNYTLVVSFMGYSEQRKTIKVAGVPMNVGRIALKEDAQTLQDVEVVAQGSSMRFELDKKVFPVDQNLSG